MIIIIATSVPAIELLAQTFDAGSNDSDGALSLTTPGVVDLDPVSLGLDADGDNIFHFTSITIDSGVTVRLSADHLAGPVFWLSSGPVLIDGEIDLNGADGQNGQDVLNAGSRFPPVSGAGGFSGGLGGVIGTTVSSAQPGSGPGAGQVVNGRGGGGAGYSINGGDSTSDDFFPIPGRSTCTQRGGGSGLAYGSSFLVPLAGGSGGAGGSKGGIVYSEQNGGTGGAGGGALFIASSTSIDINGAIRANGGKGGNSIGYGGGGGSGGAIRLAAPSIAGNGELEAKSGVGGTGRSGICPGAGSAFIRGHGGAGADGWIRMETFNQEFAGSSDPTPILSSPVALFLPETPAPQLRVTSVAGIPLVNPTGSIAPADIDIETDTAVTVQVEARNIPLTSGNPSELTIVKLYLVSENDSDQVIESTPLTGTFGLSTATIDVVFPFGFTRGFVRATWNPATP